MKLFILMTTLLLSLPTWACWNLTGSFNLNGKTLEIVQKVNHDKSYSFQNGELIVHVKLPSKFDIPEAAKNKKDVQLIQIEVVQKSGITLKTLAKSQLLVLGENEATMIKEDQETKDFTKITIKLRHL